MSVTHFLDFFLSVMKFPMLLLVFISGLFFAVRIVKITFLLNGVSFDSLPSPEVEQVKIKLDLSKKAGFSSNYDRLPDFDDLGVYPPKISSDLVEDDLTNYGGY
jgi:hypothetical protein